VSAPGADPPRAEREATAARDGLTAALARVASGDRQALRDVYERTSAKLFGICLRISQDREGAEDILQDVYVSIWNRAGRFDPTRASPITWLATIARNRAIDWKRARGRIAAGPVEDAQFVADARPLALEGLLAAEEGEKLGACLETLEERQQRAIRSAFLDGFTYADLAEREAVPLGTMKSWIRRGLIRLKACLEL